MERLRVGESIDVVAKEVTGRFYRYAVPAEEFQALLRVDKSAEHLLPGSFCGKTPTCCPVQVYGDGNCLYRAVSLAMSGHEKDHLELRLQTCLELAQHASHYATQLVNLAEGGRQTETGEQAYSPVVMLLSSLTSISDGPQMFEAAY